MIRRIAAIGAVVACPVLTLVFALVLCLAPVAGAAPGRSEAQLTIASSSRRDEEPTTTTRAPRDLPRTILEAEERDDGNGSPGPWLIGSGLAAVAAIGVGGTILMRRS